MVIEMGDEDSRRDNKPNSNSYVNKHLSMAKETKKPTNEYTAEMQAYIDHFNYILTASNLRLSSEEQKEFDEDMLDPIHFNIMDIPVQLHKNIYNLKTLTDLPMLNGKRIDPATRNEFYLSEIKPAEDINQRIQIKLKQIKNQRQKEKRETRTTEKNRSHQCEIRYCKIL